MALTSDQITAQNFKDFYGQIRPYLNGTAHGGFTPIGTVISVMGKQAPHNYLVCDGTIYNIADYPELAAYFVGQFEASNFFGGDGVTTFAVPDLRGEFLRGTGTNGHAGQGNGANVGVHQDATLMPGVDAWNGNSGDTTMGLALYTNGANQQSANVTSTDYQYEVSPRYKYQTEWKTITSETGPAASAYTARPTNTSVLYCIATKNIFMDAGHNYSTDEQVVGTWVDGKPIYQKTVSIGTETSTGMKAYTINIANTDLVMVDFSHSFHYRLSGTKEIIPISNEWDTNNTGGYVVQPSTNNFKFM